MNKRKKFLQYHNAKNLSKTGTVPIRLSGK
jgi:hypothetical protein